MAIRKRRSFALAGCLMIALAASAYLVRVWLSEPLAGAARILIEPGDNFTTVVRQLADEGIIRHPLTLIWYARVTGAARGIRSGEYRIDPDESSLGLIAMLLRGKVVQHQARLVEGWTLAQTRAYLASLEPLRQTLGQVPDTELMAVLGLEPQPSEGWFFPDTYQFERGMDDAALLRAANAKMTAELDRLWSERDAGLPYSHPYQVLIMASLIEKETGLGAERGKIARVFVSRLETGMRLQTDPTVIYGLGDDFDGNLTRAHLNQDGPYNTYRRAGLPPTPIALPGLAALEAAVHPEPGNYLYFVARGDGTSQFSATLDEHLDAVRRYQLGQ